MSSCQICTNDYGGKVVPTTLTCCGEDTICFDCLEKDRVAKISNLTGNRKKIQCMLCNKEFHSANDTPWIVNVPLIRSNGIEVDMSAVRQAQAARQQSTHAKTTTGSSIRRLHSTFSQGTEQDGGGENGDATNAVNQTEQQSSSELNLRRSKRRKVRKENVETCESDEESRFSTIDEEKNGDEEEVLEEEESVAEDEDISTMPSNSTQLYKIGTKVSKVFFDELMGKLRPYVGTITSYDPITMYYKVVYDEDGDAEDVFASGVKEILVGSSSVVGDEDTSTLSSTSASVHSQERQVSTRMTTRRQSQRQQSQQKLLVTVNGKTYSEDTVDDIYDDNEEGDIELDEDAKHWVKQMSRSNLNVYRIRCYKTISITNEDPYAFRCSQWCVDNGCIVTCAEIANMLPVSKRLDASALKSNIFSVDHDTMYQTLKNEYINGDNDFNFEKEKKYVKSYRQFIEMKSGDMIILQTGRTDKGPPQILTFGVVQDDSLSLMHRDEAMKKLKFPWDFRNRDGTHRLGLMMRKVQWYRQGETKTVRGPSQVNWLADCIPGWMGKIGVKTPEYLKQAIKNMTSNKFLKNTHAIDNKWTTR